MALVFIFSPQRAPRGPNCDFKNRPNTAKMLIDTVFIRRGRGRVLG
jgi:hypothetical protein